jgi:hypothetical protein
VAPAHEDEDGSPSTSYVVFSAIDAYGSASAKLKELGFRVNAEESGLVYRVRGAGGVRVGGLGRVGHDWGVAIGVHPTSCVRVCVRVRVCASSGFAVLRVGSARSRASRLATPGRVA